MSTNKCTAITTMGTQCTRYSRCNGLCIMHYNKQKIDSDSESDIGEESENDENDNYDVDLDKLANERINELMDENVLLSDEIKKKDKLIISITKERDNMAKQIQNFKKSYDILNNEVKKLTDIKSCSENKFSELNEKIKTLNIEKLELENKINEIYSDVEKKINIRVNMLKEEYKNNIFDNDKYNKMSTICSKIKSDLNLITSETIGDKIEKRFITTKNNLKVMVKYFKGTEQNIEEFMTKFSLDLENLINGIIDSQYQNNNEWVEKIITNNENYTVKFNDYFKTVDNVKIKINWIKSEGKYILQIYPDIEHVMLILDSIKNQKKMINNLNLDIADNKMKINNFELIEKDLQNQIKNKDLMIKESFLCTLCFTKTINTCFVPCSHAYCCTTCANKLNECPVCRQKIKNKINIYLT